jgi:CoA:oxalate CoA-transferase
MLDSVFSMMLTPLSRALYFDQSPTRVGNRHPETYPVDSFPTQTGDIVLVGFSNKVFRKLMAVIGRPELVDDPRFANNEDRNTHEAELRDIISQWTSSKTAEEALAQLAAASIPCAPVWTLDQVLNSDHVRSREMIKTGRHTKLGEVPFVPQPVKFSDGQRATGQTAPMLGEHTEEVLRERLALDDVAIAALRDEGVI